MSKSATGSAALVLASRIDLARKGEREFADCYDENRPDEGLQPGRRHRLHPVERASPESGGEGAWKESSLRQQITNERYKELVRGVGLASHDVGIGAFIYLRRVFENLIDAAHLKVKSEAGWDETIYEKSRMDEKIQLLKDFLPSFLVENRVLYKILSSGVHELSEQDCLKAFPAVKLGIELILDDELERHKREKKIEEAKKALSLTAQGIKQPKT